MLDHQYPLPLHHSWPLFERARHFDLGWVDRDSVRPTSGIGGPSDADGETLERMGVGVWRCDLAGERLNWSAVVHDLFDLPREVAPTRAFAVAQYCESSRAAMERLRAHAITHRRGFTLDVEIGPALARPRRVRLIAAPLCEDGEVVALQGWKRLLPD